MLLGNSPIRDVPNDEKASEKGKGESKKKTSGRGDGLGALRLRGGNRKEGDVILADIFRFLLDTERERNLRERISVVTGIFFWSGE